MEIENAQITSTTLGIERGVFTYMLNLDYGGSAQGAGGIRLDNEGWGGCAGYLRNILETVGVRSWEDLPGNLFERYGEGYAMTELAEDAVEDE